MNRVAMIAKNVRILVIDPSEEVRRSLRDLIVGTKYSVVGEASCGDDAVAKYDELRPQITVMDVNAPGHRDAPGGGGLEVMRRVLEKDEKARIVVVSTVDTRYLRMTALKAGAVSQVSYPFRRDELLKGLAAAETARVGAAAVQRTDVRLKKSLAVKYKKSTDGLFTSMRNVITEDISPSGLAIRTPENLAEKTVLKLEIEIPGQPKIQARGKVGEGKRVEVCAEEHLPLRAQ